FTPIRMSLGCCDMTMRLFSFKLNMAFLPAKYGSAKNLNKTVDFGWLPNNGCCPVETWLRKTKLYRTTMIGEWFS
ncbi:MAG: hypothetical protein PUF27_08245, partial [Bacteroidales bacterium]|nr:hypothetical protein [Bacteroidales bacterium]MDD6555588.1 hypothetical protein [Bacteroidales bacterium]